MISFIYNLFTRSIVVVLVSSLAINYLPNELFNDFPIEPKSREEIDYNSVIPKPWNPILSNEPVEFHGLNQILGPESLAVSSEGLIYTGLADGQVVELNPKKKYSHRQVLRFKKSPHCKDHVALQSIDCGRFLQMRFINSTLYGLEASTGLYSIDIIAGTKKLVGPSPAFDKINLYNSFAFDPKQPNLVYISVSSTKWDIKNIIWSIMELEASGKLIALDISTGKRVVVLDQLQSANGVDVDVKGDRLLLAETTKSQITSVSLSDIRDAFKKAKDGDKAFDTVSRTLLIPTVPGNPDNIVIADNLAYIALPFVKPNGKELVDIISKMPGIRKAICRLEFILGKALQYVHKNLYQHPLLEMAYEDLMSGHINYRVMNPSKSAVLEYNLVTGSSRLLGSDNFSFISEAIPDRDGYLYLGSFRSPFIVRTKV